MRVEDGSYAWLTADSGELKAKEPNWRKLLHCISM